ncbi:unnamed protein product, partial [Ixodes pacificus]
RYVSESVQDTDPCENFYEYVCSNWSSNYTLDGEAAFSEDVSSERALENDLLNILSTESDDASLAPLFDLFRACFDESRLNADAQTVLDSILKSADLSGFPFKSDNGHLSASAGRLLRITGVSPLVKVTIDPSDNTIKLDRPDTLFPDFTYVPNAHRSWYSDAVRLAARTPMPELFDFEQDLVASMYFPGTGESYVLVSAHDLTRNPEWDWQEFLANVFYGIQDIKHTTKVKLQPNQFGTKLMELLTTWRPAVVLNYLVFRLLLSYAPLMTSMRFRKLSEVTISSRPGWENKWGVNRSHACARMVARSEPGLVAFLLLSRHKQDQHEPMLRSVVEHGRREFVDFLGEISWITASFMEKLESRFRKLKIAFFMPPEWKKFPFRVSQCHSFKCAVADKPVIDTFQKMIAQRERRRLGSFIKPFPDYPSDIFETHVKLIGDTLIIPLALIRYGYRREAFWQYHLPRVLVAVSSTFVAIFRQEVSTWRRTYLDLFSRFSTTEHCLRTMYTSFVSPTPAILSSNTTGARDFVDFLAVQAAFRMYQRLAGQQTSLPGLPFTTDQLFFVHFALSRCEKYNSNFEEQLLRHGNRAHAAFRVNGPLKHFVTFSSAFQCRQGAFMNPKSKCVF